MMNESDRKAFAAMIFKACASYQQSMDPARLQVYWESLAAYPFEQVNKAFDLHMKDPDVGQYFPRVSHITRIMFGTSETLAAAAWQSIETQIRRGGVYHNPTFEDPLISPLINALGGWVAFCHTKITEFPLLSVRFQRMYMQQLKRKQHEAAHVERIDAPQSDKHEVTDGTES
jgi:hypothetical protein